MNAFPVPAIADRIYKKYFRPTGKAPFEPYKRARMLSANLSREANELLVVSNFAEVFLAKEGHRGLVGINYLEKIQMATLASLYGAMLADVDYVLMGAGIPREIPGILDKLAMNENVELKLQVELAGPEDSYLSTFSPAEVLGCELAPLRRPKFLAIIASSTLATTLARKATGKIDGFVVEGPTAGGHNAPPRGNAALNPKGEPAYGPRDQVDLEKIKELGLPFWLAGSYGSLEGLQLALEMEAVGVQVGTPFALCRESGLSERLKSEILILAQDERVEVFTDPSASPTGFPFKIARLPGTLSESEVYQKRTRRCDVGYLRKPYKRADGSLGYRCPAEPIDLYVKKQGTAEEAEARRCLCNALLANIDLGQCQDGQEVEKPLVTIGNDVNQVRRFMQPGSLSFSASDVVRTLLQEPAAQV